MSKEEEHSGGCIYCGQPLSAHKGGWCESQEEADALLEELYKEDK